jgi:hypothetical protein
MHLRALTDVHAIFPAGRGAKLAARAFADYLEKELKAEA